MQIKSIEDLHREKAAGLARLYPSTPKILVGMATCGLAAGAQRIYDLLQHKAHASHWDGTVEKTGCIGFCYKEPLVDVIIPGKPRLTYELMTQDLAAKLWEELAAGQIPKEHLMARIDVDEMLLDGGPRKLYQGKLPKVFAATPRYEDLDFFKLQRHIAMRNCGFIDPDNLPHYIARGGYFALYKALTAMTPEEVIDAGHHCGAPGPGRRRLPHRRQVGLLPQGQRLAQIRAVQRRRRGPRGVYGPQPHRRRPPLHPGRDAHRRLRHRRQRGLRLRPGRVPPGGQDPATGHSCGPGGRFAGGEHLRHRL